jgi:hypothetical protein
MISTRGEQAALRYGGVSGKMEESDTGEDRKFNPPERRQSRERNGQKQFVGGR